MGHMSASRKLRRRDLNHTIGRQQQRAAADPTERSVLELSDKIVDLAIGCTAGPAIAVTGVIEALVRLALSTEVPNIENVVHSQISMMFEDMAPKAAYLGQKLG